MSHFQLGAKTRTSGRKKLGSVSNAGAMVIVLRLSDPGRTLRFPDQSVITRGSRSSLSASEEERHVCFMIEEL